MAREYFALKRRLLGLDVLKNTDLYAPLPGVERRYTFAESWSLVQEAYAGFHPELAAALAGLAATGPLPAVAACGRAHVRDRRLRHVGVGEA